MTVKFAIVGTGNIATTFVEDAEHVETCQVVAVTSRSMNKANEFAAKYNIENSYDDFDKMLKSDIDAVYIALPHPYHYEYTIGALKAGKAVLCEKPFAMNYQEASEMIEVAKKNECLLMEAMWTRFFPAYDKMMALLNQIGQILFIKSDFGFRQDQIDPQGRLLNPKLGGGALLDVGIYPISIVRDIMKKDPIEIKCTSMKTPDGIDLMSVYNYRFYDGALACLYSAIQVQTQTELFISGTKGSIHIPEFYCPEAINISLFDGSSEKYTFDKIGHGYTYEIKHFCDLYLKGSLESPKMPLNETLAIMKLLDKIKDQIDYLKKV